MSLTSLNGRHFRFCFNELLDYTGSRISSKEGEQIALEGEFVDIIDYLSVAYNFTYSLVTYSLRTTSGAYVNGEWNGGLRLLDLGQADSCISYVTLNYDRLRDFFFTFPYLGQSEAHVLYATADDYEANSFDIRTAVPLVVWYLMGFGVLVSSFYWLIAFRVLGGKLTATNVLETLNFHFGKLTGAGPSDLEGVSESG